MIAFYKSIVSKNKIGISLASLTKAYGTRADFGASSFF